MKTRFLVIVVIGMVVATIIAISIVFFLNFIPDEKLELCAGLYDDMMKNKNSEELRLQYDENDCSDSILQWTHLAESKVTIPE